jgi:hypothetical protein
MNIIVRVLYRMSGSNSATYGGLLEDESESLHLSTPPSDGWDDWEVTEPFQSEMITLISRKKEIVYYKAHHLHAHQNANGRITFFLIENETNLSYKVQQISSMEDSDLKKLIDAGRVDVEMADRIKDTDGGGKIAYLFHGWVYYKRKGG